MKTIGILQFLNQKYKESDNDADRTDISVLYWTILDYSLQSIEPAVNLKEDGIKSAILN